MKVDVFDFTCSIKMKRHQLQISPLQTSSRTRAQWTLRDFNLLNSKTRLEHFMTVHLSLQLEVLSGNTAAVSDLRAHRGTVLSPSGSKSSRREKT